MTRDPDFIGALEEYLDEHQGSTPLPDAARDAIRAELPSIQQRPAWWPGWRFPEMNSIVKISLAVAAVAVAAVLGVNYLGSSNVGGPGPDDSPPTPTSTPQALYSGSNLSPGTYAIEAPFPVRVTLDLPDGWFSWASNASVVGLVVDNSMGDGASGWGPAFWIVDNVYADPCDPTSKREPKLGPSVDDLVAALTSLPGYETTVPTNVTVSGFSGMELELTAPEYGDECPAHRTWSTAGSDPREMLPGETNRIQILDVDGTRLVLSIVEYAHTTEFEESLGISFDADAHVADQPELRRILDSMRIESRP